MAKLHQLLDRWAGIAANAVLYPLAGFARRRPDDWVFGHANDEFLGNPRYLFLWVSKNRPGIKATWITGSGDVARMLRSNGYRANKRWSIAGMLAVLRARVLVTAHTAKDVNLPLSRGAMILNLWHGVGLKPISFGDPNGATGRALRRSNRFIGRMKSLHLLLPNDLLVTTSEKMQTHFAGQFRMSPSRCPQIGYSRLDCSCDLQLLKQSATVDRALGFNFEEFGQKELYIYMPTFRDSGRPFLEEAFPDLDRISAILKARDAVLFIKLHPRTPDQVPAKFENIRVWPGHIDIYTYMSKLILITDYSSVLYDFVAIDDKASIIYTFDFEEYMTRDRALVGDFAENTAGLRVQTFDELCDTLERGSVFDTPATEETFQVKSAFWGGSETPASPAIVDYVQQHLRRNS